MKRSSLSTGLISSSRRQIRTACEQMQTFSPNQSFAIRERVLTDVTSDHAMLWRSPNGPSLLTPFSSILMLSVRTELQTASIRLRSTKPGNPKSTNRSSYNLPCRIVTTMMHATPTDRATSMICAVASSLRAFGTAGDCHVSHISHSYLVRSGSIGPGVKAPSGPRTGPRRDSWESCRDISGTRHGRRKTARWPRPGCG